MRMQQGVGLIGVQSTRAYAAPDRAEPLRDSILGVCKSLLKYRQSPERRRGSLPQILM
jgi:hypothetical protein